MEYQRRRQRENSAGDEEVRSYMISSPDSSYAYAQSVSSGWPFPHDVDTPTTPATTKKLEAAGRGDGFQSIPVTTTKITSDTDGSYDYYPATETNQQQQQQTPDLALPWRDSRWYSYWGILFLDVFQILLVLPFVALAAIVLFQDGKTTDEVIWMPDIITAAKYGPTIFPILFALVVGRLTKAVAYHKLERRTTIKTMEQLYGSRTVISAYVTQFKMRGFNLLGLAIVLAWALSPIGSQASLRVASIVDVSRVSGFNLSYMDPRSVYSPGDFGFSIPLAASLFTSTITMPIRTHSDAHDVWGNVRVPMVEELEREAGGVEPSLDWFSMEEGRPAGSNSSSVPYASLIGVPMTVNSSLSPSQRTGLEYVFNTSYWWLDCTTEKTTDPAFAFPLTVANYSAGSTSTRMGWSTMLRQVSIPHPSDFPLNETLQDRRVIAFPWTPRQVYLAADFPLSTTVPRPLFSAVCNLTTTFVAVRAVCNGATSESGTFSATSGSSSSSSSSSSASSGGSVITSATTDQQQQQQQGCRATAIRRTSTNRTQATMSLLDVIGVGRDTTFLQNFLNSTTLGSSSRLRQSALTPNIGYLADPSNPFGFETNYPNWTTTTVSSRDFALRLSQVLNTFWLASVGYKPVQGEFRGGYRSSVSGTGGGLSATDQLLNGGGFLLVDEAGEASVHRAALKCDKGWTAALLVASALLLVAASATMVLGLYRRVPDVLDKFSSLVKDNPYAMLQGSSESYEVRGGGGGGLNLNSMLDGFERARRIRNLEVQIGDVAPGLENGYVAVGTPQTILMERLRVDRKYV